MKKVLSILAIFVLTITLVACKKGDKIDPAQATIDGVYETLPSLFRNPEQIKENFKLPAVFANGAVTGTWKSSQPGVVSIGEKDGNTLTVTVNRPANEDGNIDVLLEVELVITSELDSSKTIKKEWSITLTIIAQDPIEGEYTTFKTIFDEVINGEIELTNFRTPTITVKGVKYLGETTGGYHVVSRDGVIAYVHGKGTIPTDKTKVYDVNAKVYDYFGYLQLEDVAYTESSASITFVENFEETTIEEINSIDLEKSNYPKAWTLKNVRFYIDTTISATNYNLVLIPADLDPATAPRKTVGDLHLEDAVMIYYTSNDFSKFRALNGLVAEEVKVIYEGYRTDRHVYYVTILSDSYITLESLTDEEKVNVVKNSLEVVTDFPKGGDLVLPTSGDFDTAISWSFSNPADENNDLINLETGKVTTPENARVVVKIKATITLGSVEVTKEFEINVGEYLLQTIADALEADSKEVIKVKGVVTGLFANRTYGFQDGTNSIALYVASNQTLPVGKEITIIGEKDVYKGLPQLKNLTVEDEASGVMPQPFAIDGILANNTELEKHIAKLVSVTNVEVTAIGTKDSNGNFQVTVKKGEVSLIIRYDSRTTTEIADLEALKVGDIINYVGHLGWFDGPQLGFGPETFVGEGEPEVPTLETEVLDFTTLADNTTYVTTATEFKVGEVDLVRLHTNISSSKDQDTGTVIQKGLVMGIRAGTNNANNFGSPYIATKGKVAQATKVEFEVYNWNKDADFNLDNFASGIYVQTSTDGENWTNGTNFISTWDKTAYGKNTVSVTLDPETPVYVRLFVESKGPQSSKNQLRLIVSKMTIVR